MMKEKPTLPKGMRDFSPEQVAKRQYIINIIKSVFEKYGFMPIETPTMENLSVLTGKYGDEGDKLLFKVLNSGDYLEKVKAKTINEEDFGKISIQTYLYIYSILKESIEENKSVDEVLDSGNFSINNSYTNNEDYENLVKSFLKTIIEILSEIGEKIQLGLKSKDYNFEYYFHNSMRTYYYGIDSLYSLNRDSGIYNLLILFIKESDKYRFFGDFKSKDITPEIVEKGLRYDLTVPFARYVVMNQNDITFPFKRYQIQPVWRADRPQKGRYREFYQCDADVIGTNSLLCEAEIIMMIQEVFEKLRLTDYTIKINNRKVLESIAELYNCKNKFMELTVIIDKLDKIGFDGVIQELEKEGINTAVGSFFIDYKKNYATNEEKIAHGKHIFSNKVEGITEIEKVLTLSSGMGANLSKVEFDATLARGLSYYTGCIFEVKVNNVSIGSMSGGGRYDNLTESFGLPNVSGVGFSFGLDRIYDVITELKLFPESIVQSTKVLIIPFDEDDFNYSLNVLKMLRSHNINSELYPDMAKLKKAMAYANAKQIPFVIIIGSNERKSALLTLKDMQSGTQQNLSLNDVMKTLR